MYLITSHINNNFLRTGKEVRLVSGGQITQLEDVDADEAFTLPLVHNLSVLVDAASAEIQRVTRQCATEKVRPYVSCT
jgi:hypothetical protein